MAGSVLILSEEPLDDLAELLELMEFLEDEQCLRLYGFTADMVAAEIEKRENSTNIN